MAGWLAPDTKFYNGLLAVTEAIIINVLFVLFCLPIVTVGASAAGAHAALLQQLREEGSSPARTFWNSFKKTFRRATGAWLSILVLLLVATWEIWAIGRMALGLPGTIATILSITGIILILGFAIWYFPYISQYRAPMSSASKRSALLAIRFLPRTLVCLALLLIQPVILYLNPDILGVLVFANLIILPAAIIYVHDLLLATPLKTFGSDE
ncbi:YesL family protein [Flaviflexus massiliensis]|uniref:YesL family protein n=1 Tax=Flaviflexus massiliensis TaxID=1522309 RepID=UPI0006D55C47|nr:YesL family protein [Flaviflexus massiliensis]